MQGYETYLLIRLPEPKASPGLDWIMPHGHWVTELALQSCINEMLAPRESHHFFNWASPKCGLQFTCSGTPESLHSSFTINHVDHFSKYSEILEECYNSQGWPGWLFPYSRLHVFMCQFSSSTYEGKETSVQRERSFLGSAVTGWDQEVNSFHLWQGHRLKHHLAVVLQFQKHSVVYFCGIASKRITSSIHFWKSQNSGGSLFCQHFESKLFWVLQAPESSVT